MEKTTTYQNRPTCRSCDAYDSLGNGTEICRLNPPAVSTHLISDPRTPGQGQIMQQTSWPVINGLTDWCKKYETKPN